MKHGPELSFDDDGRPVLITAAALPYEEEHRQRVRKYLTLMTIRIPALILAAVAYGIWHNGLISLLIVAASVPLPWIAVLIANDRPPRRAEEPSPVRQAPAAHASVPDGETAGIAGPEPTSRRKRRARIRLSPSGIRTLWLYSQHILRSSLHNRSSEGLPEWLRGNSNRALSVALHDSSRRSGGRNGKRHRHPG